MTKTAILVVVVVLLVALAPTTSRAQATIFAPAQCRRLCQGRFSDVRDANDDFLSIDPNGSSSFVKSRASTWGVSLLRLVKDAVKTPPSAQDVTITPPAVARLLGGYSLAVYQAFAVWSEYLYPYGRYFQPLSSDMVNLKDLARAKDWDALTEPFGQAQDVFVGPDLANFAPSEEEASAAQRAAISGAASRFISLFFCNSRATQPVWCQKADQVLSNAMGFVGNSDRENFPIPFRQGEDIASEVFDQLSIINLLQDNSTTLLSRHPDIANISASPQQRSQPTAAVHDCSRVSSLRGPWYWQRLTVPRANNIFRPNANATLSPFPPAGYASLGLAEVNTPFFRGFAAAIAPAALRSTQEARPMLLQGLTGPPKANDEAGFRRAMREVLQQSATLDDKKKVIAEFWADGPESTTPPGHWFKIAMEESNSNDAFILKDLNVLDRTVWATLLVGLSLHEAGLMAWELKLEHMGSRPITGIQCLVGRNTGTNTLLGTAWRGPYMGVGRRDLGTWQPFQAVTFVTPPFSGYVSGHATFSAAAAEALRQTRSGFNTTFQTPSYNCYRTPAGFSTVEPLIPANQPGGVAGVTDRPNRGPKTVGYSPARNVVMCWQKYEEAAEQAALSRLYGGIHIALDNDDGLKLGKRLGENVAASLVRLSPAYTMPKEPIESRPTPLLNFDIFDTPVVDFVCPPGTFVRTWDGRHDAAGLYALGVTCSDGTFIGTLGTWGPGRDEFVQATVTDGYVGITAVISTDGAVVGASFQDRAFENSDLYGMSSGQRVTTSCDEDQRIVGLTTRSAGGTGNIGTFGLLCGKVITEDVTFRSDPVPASPDAGLWSYDYQCPEGIFITRFFGRAGAYINTLTAQCGSRWNLRNVGIPFFAKPGDAPFTHTSVDGYSGIDVKSFTGGVDCLRFVTAAGVQSPPVGNPAVPGPWFELRCDGNSRIIGIFGWQDAYVASLGIICSPGDFGAITASTKALRMRRNAVHVQRIPGRGIIANTTSEVVAASAIPMPTQRIPTNVTGASKVRKVGAPAGVPLVDGLHSTQADGALPLRSGMPGPQADKASALEKAVYLMDGATAQKATTGMSSAPGNATTVSGTQQLVSPPQLQQPL